jgi:hypothetical protein
MIQLDSKPGEPQIKPLRKPPTLEDRSDAYVYLGLSIRSRWRIARRICLTTISTSQN